MRRVGISQLRRNMGNGYFRISQSLLRQFEFYLVVQLFKAQSPRFEAPLQAAYRHFAEIRDIVYLAATRSRINKDKLPDCFAKVLFDVKNCLRAGRGLHDFKVNRQPQEDGGYDDAGVRLGVPQLCLPVQWV